jgi:hypothetical protein
MLIHMPPPSPAPHVHNLYFYVTLHEMSLVQSSDIALAINVTSHEVSSPEESFRTIS